MPIFQLSTALEFARIFELESPKKSAAITANNEDESPRKSDPMLTRVARYVAATGQVSFILPSSVVLLVVLVETRNNKSSI